MIDFNSIPDLKRQEVDVREWNGTVLIQELSATDRAELEQLFAGKTGESLAMRREVLKRALIKADGSKALENGQAEMMLHASGSAVERIFTAAMTLSGIGKSDDEAAKN